MIFNFYTSPPVHARVPHFLSFFAYLCCLRFPLALSVLKLKRRKIVGVWCSAFDLDDG